MWLCGVVCVCVCVFCFSENMSSQWLQLFDHNLCLDGTDVKSVKIASSSSYIFHEHTLRSLCHPNTHTPNPTHTHTPPPAHAGRGRREVVFCIFPIPDCPSST